MKRLINTFNNVHKKLSASDWLKISAYFINTSHKTTKFKVENDFVKCKYLEGTYLVCKPCSA